MKRIAVLCLFGLVMLFSNGCSNENNYTGSFGEYELLDVRITDPVDEDSQYLVILEMQYVNTTDAEHKPVDSIEKDLIIVNRADSMEVDAILFNRVIREGNDAVRSVLAEEDVDLINNGYISVEPGESIQVALTATVPKVHADHLYLRDKDPNHLNGTKYNRKIELW